MTLLSRFSRFVQSFLWGVRVETVQSELSGPLEVWLWNGRYVLNSANANYSFGLLHRVFQQSFRHPLLKGELPNGKVLILGFGAGSVASIIHRELKWDRSIVGVEYDPLVLDIGRRYFGLAEHDKLTLLQAEAGSFLNADKDRYALIVVDLFVDLHVPDEFTQEEFLEKATERLLGNGILLLNIMPREAYQQAQIDRAVSVLEGAPGKVNVIRPHPENRMVVFRKISTETFAKS